MEISYEEINKLYMTCREVFKERYADLKSAKDDKFFLLDAIECELCTNTISLCIEMFYSLTDSPAAETSCRSILEALALHRMVSDHCLDEEQIANFKHQSALLFFGNLFSTGKEEELLTKEQEKLIRDKHHWIFENYEEAIKAYKRTYGSKFDDGASRAAIWDSLFFANKDPSRKKRQKFSDICKDYLINTKTDKTGAMYDRVSFFAHPWYVDNPEDLKTIIAARQKDIALCYEAAREFFINRMDAVSDDARSMLDDLASIGFHAKRADDIKDACFGLFAMAIGPNGDTKGHISYTALCMYFLRSILFEMNILSGLGYYEIALSKFQTIAEFWGINGLINSTEDIAQRKAIQQAFDYSTRVQLHKQWPFRDFLAKVPFKGDDVLKAAYDAAPCHSAISFEDYLDKIKNGKDSFLFLRPFYSEQGTGFLDLARSASSKTFLPNRQSRSKEFMLSYFFSIDFHHATGFCYTLSKDTWPLLSHEALIGIYESLLVFAMFAGRSSDEAALAARPVIQGLTNLVKEEQEEIKDLSLKYPEC